MPTKILFFLASSKAFTLPKETISLGDNSSESLSFKEGDEVQPAIIYQEKTIPLSGETLKIEKVVREEDQTKVYLRFYPLVV